MLGDRMIYAIVTDDKFELPLFYGTHEQVAKRLGVTSSTVICRANYKSRKGKSRTKSRDGVRIVKVGLESEVYGHGKEENDMH